MLKCNRKVILFEIERRGSCYFACVPVVRKSYQNSVVRRDEQHHEFGLSDIIVSSTKRVIEFTCWIDTVMLRTLDRQDRTLDLVESGSEHHLWAATT